MEYPKFKVAVRCFTYNQSAYITDTMNGFTRQQTDFPFVCCIVDDASTDGEQDVISHYLKNHFDFSDGSCHFRRETDYATITYARHKTNRNCHFAVLYLKENHHPNPLRQKKIAYIAEWADLSAYEALCEGDDYWTDSEKLQRQADCLDAHPTCALVYSKALVWNQKEGKFSRTLGKPVSSFLQLMSSNVVPTLTTLARRSCLEEYRREVQPFSKEWKAGDYPMWLWMSLRYGIHFMDATTGVYRLLPDSMSHSTSIEKALRYNDSITDIVHYFLNLSQCSEKTRRLVLSNRYKTICRTLVDSGHDDLVKQYASQIKITSFSNLLMRIILSNRTGIGLYRFYRSHKPR